jgi:large subunit ribosomal protein L30
MIIAIIRIAGNVKLRNDIEETFSRLRMRRKYTCVVRHEDSKIKGVLKKLRDFSAYGEIDEKILEQLIHKRGVAIDKKDKIDGKKISNEFIKGKNLEKLNIKPFFRLHPPRGGIDTKHHYPKGVLGDHGANIKKLIERML